MVSPMRLPQCCLPRTGSHTHMSIAMSIAIHGVVEFVRRGAPFEIFGACRRALHGSHMSIAMSISIHGVVEFVRRGAPFEIFGARRPPWIAILI